MKKLYERPLAEVIEVTVNDIITESSTEYGTTGLSSMAGAGSASSYTEWFDESGGGKIKITLN